MGKSIKKQLEEERKMRREYSHIVRLWQEFIVKVAKPLRCSAMTDEVLAAVKKMKRELREARKTIREMKHESWYARFVRRRI